MKLHDFLVFGIVLFTMAPLFSENIYAPEAWSISGDWKVEPTRLIGTSGKILSRQSRLRDYEMAFDLIHSEATGIVFVLLREDSGTSYYCAQEEKYRELVIGKKTAPSTFAKMKGNFATYVPSVERHYRYQIVSLSNRFTILVDGKKMPVFEVPSGEGLTAGRIGFQLWKGELIISNLSIKVLSQSAEEPPPVRGTSLDDLPALPLSLTNNGVALSDVVARSVRDLALSGIPVATMDRFLPAHEGVIPLAPFPSQGFDLEYGASLTWEAAVRGENIALGRPVQFNIPAGYYGYGAFGMGAGDAFDLTDGKRADRYAAASTVFFREGIDSALVKIDLGSDRAFEDIAVSAWGRGRTGVAYLGRIEIFASIDDEHFYLLRAASRRLFIDQAKPCFDVPEEDRFPRSERGEFRFPVVFRNIHSHGRYIVLKFYRYTHSMMIDEIAITRGAGAEATTALSGPPVRFNFKPEVEVVCRAPKIEVPRHFTCGVYYSLIDRRSERRPLANATFIVLAPPGLRVSSGSNAHEGGDPLRFIGEATPIMIEGVSYLRSVGIYHEEYYKAPGVVNFTTASPEGTAGKIIAWIEYGDGAQSTPATTPFFVVPELTPLPRSLTNLMIDWGWGSCLEWETLNRSGLNTVCIGFSKSMRGNLAQQGAFADRIRKAGYFTSVATTPFLEPSFWADDESKLHFRNGTLGKGVDPSHRGKAYRRFMEIAEGFYGALRPDIFNFDSEGMWGSTFTELTNSSTYAAGDGDPSRLLKQQVAHAYGDFTQARRRQAALLGNTPPAFGEYDWDPVHSAANGGANPYDFDLLYQAGFRVASPEFYWRMNYKDILAHLQLIKEKKPPSDLLIRPWIDPSANWVSGSFPAAYLRDYLLMTVFNGANGVIFFEKTSFSPGDFKYLNEAVRVLLPVEDIIARREEVTGYLADHGASVRAYRNGNELAFLIYDLDHLGDVVSTVTIPLDSPGVLYDLDSGKQVSSWGAGKNTFGVVLQGGYRSRAFYVGQKWPRS